MIGRRDFLGSVCVLAPMGLAVANPALPEWGWNESLSPEENLSAAQKSFETRYNVNQQQGTKRFSPTGEEYVEVCIGGVKLEGERAPAVATTAQWAVKLWFSAVQEYARSRAGTDLYWRIYPEISKFAYLSYFKSNSRSMRDLPFWVEPSYWHVYSRLLVTNQALLS